DAAGALPDLSANRGGPEPRGLLATLARSAALAVGTGLVFVAAVGRRRRGRGALSAAGRPRGCRAAAGFLRPRAPAAGSRRGCRGVGGGLRAAGAGVWAVRLVPERAVHIPARAALALRAVFPGGRRDRRLRHRTRPLGARREAGAAVAGLARGGAAVVFA